MSKVEYRPPPVTPDAHLEQLAALKDADEGSLSELQKRLRRSLLSSKGTKALRVMHIRDMAVAGFTAEQIKLAFAAPDSPYNPLIAKLQTEAAAKTFKEEIYYALNEVAGMDAVGHRAIYVREQQRLYNVCWEFLRRGDSTSNKTMVELMYKLQQNIAEAHGAVHRQAGKRQNTQQVDKPAPASAEEAAEGDADVAPIDWKEEFEPDDSTAD